jgi:branched-chain amino acid transport system substrate-binding protein
LRGRWLAGLGCLLGTSALAAIGCGGGGGGGGPGATVKGNTLTVYSSLPLQGPTRVNSVAVNNGAKIALSQANNKVGKYTIKFKTLDDSTAAAGKWDPSQTADDARKAVSDPTTIAYMGEFNSGASAISIPILNKAGILQVSPANTAVGLTKKEPGSTAGEPTKYYPTGTRTYGRVVPRDKIQGAAMAIAMKDAGCKKAYVLNDKEVYGAGLASNFVSSAKTQGLTVLGNEGYDPKASNYRSLASKIKSKGADCVFGSLIVDNNGVQLFKDLASGVPGAKLFAPDGCAESTFTDPKKGGVPASIAPRIQLTQPTLSPKDYPPAGRKFFADYKAKYGAAEPYAIYGYEAMSAIMDSIKRAGSKGNSRSDVRKMFFSIKDRKSVLGTYSIDKDGDTTITAEGLYNIKNGTLTFDKSIKASV